MGKGTKKARTHVSVLLPVYQGSVGPLSLQSCGGTNWVLGSQTEAAKGWPCSSPSVLLCAAVGSWKWAILYLNLLHYVFCAVLEAIANHCFPEPQNNHALVFQLPGQGWNHKWPKWLEVCTDSSAIVQSMLEERSWLLCLNSGLIPQVLETETWFSGESPGLYCPVKIQMHCELYGNSLYCLYSVNEHSFCNVRKGSILMGMKEGLWAEKKTS